METSAPGDGTVTYTELKGDVRFFDMTFGYTEMKKWYFTISHFTQSRVRRLPS